MASYACSRSAVRRGSGDGRLPAADAASWNSTRHTVCTTPEPSRRRTAVVTLDESPNKVPTAWPSAVSCTQLRTRDDSGPDCPPAEHAPRVATRQQAATTARHRAPEGGRPPRPGLTGSRRHAPRPAGAGSFRAQHVHGAAALAEHDVATLQQVGGPEQPLGLLLAAIVHPDRTLGDGSTRVAA